MKKALLVLFCLIAAGLCVPAPCSADAGGICGENVTWSYNASNGVLTISGNGATEDYNSWDDMPWYSRKRDIREAVISDGVTGIGAYAFCGCDGMTRVTIPDSVTVIGSSAFYGCSGLTGIYAPSSLKKIRDNAFPNNEGMILYCCHDSVAERYGTVYGFHVELLDGPGAGR